MLKNRVPFNLQFFAEDPQGGQEGNNGENGENTGTDITKPTDKVGDAGAQTEPTFDDLLKKGHQSEFDRRVQKEINNALIKQKEKYEALMDDKLSEAEKLAKMSKEEKEQYLRQKHINELADREKAITRRELTAEAKNTLAEKELPVELAEMLDYTDADSCKTSIEIVEGAFRKAVEKAVEDRLKGGKPPKKAPDNGQVYTKEQVNAMSTAEINKNWDAISKSMENWK